MIEKKLSSRNEGLSITWTNLKVAVQQKKTGVFQKTVATFKEIIHNVDGAVEAGTLVAILGASGSGKTTLMSTLANRNPGGLRVNGSVKIGGRSIGDFIRHVTGFVYQEDLFIEILTVFEHLNFTAKLRLDKNMTERNRKKLIYAKLKELGLLNIADSPIGSSKFENKKTNISGGERKRLSIANELLTDPPLLFCDEPTTGLDSFTALKVVSNLEYLASQRQKTIICSVHQPNDKIFSLFHQIILLCDGKIAFSGNSKEALEFFENQGYACIEGQNLADHLIKSLAHITTSADEADKLYSAFQSSEYHDKMMKRIRLEDENEINNTDSALIRRTKCNEPPWFSKLWYLTHRNFITTIRDPSIMKTRLIEKLLIGVIVGLCLRGTTQSTQTGLQTLRGIIFMLTAYNFIPPIYAAMNHVPKQMSIFIRERANNINTPSIFYISNIISTLPAFLIEPNCYALTIYFLTSPSSGICACLLTCLITTALFNASTSFGMFLSMVFERRETAETCALVIEFIHRACSGIFINLSTIPRFFRLINYSSLFAYAEESLYVVYLRNSDYIECSRNTRVPCFDNGPQVLASLGLNENNLWFNISVMLFIYFFMHSMAYVGLLFKMR